MTQTEEPTFGQTLTVGPHGQSLVSGDELAPGDYAVVGQAAKVRVFAGGNAVIIDGDLPAGGDYEIAGHYLDRNPAVAAPVAAAAAPAAAPAAPASVSSMSADERATLREQLAAFDDEHDTHEHDTP